MFWWWGKAGMVAEGASEVEMAREGMEVLSAAPISATRSAESPADERAISGGKYTSGSRVRDDSTDIGFLHFFLVREEEELLPPCSSSDASTMSGARPGKGTCVDPPSESLGGEGLATTFPSLAKEESEVGSPEPGSEGRRCLRWGSVWDKTAGVLGSWFLAAAVRRATRSSSQRERKTWTVE